MIDITNSFLGFIVTDPVQEQVYKDLFGINAVKSILAGGCLGASVVLLARSSKRLIQQMRTGDLNNTGKTTAQVAGLLFASATSVYLAGNALMDWNQDWLNYYEEMGLYTPPLN